MTTYLGEKAVGVGTIKTYVAVADVLHDNTLVGNGNTEPLGVNTENIVSQQTLANTVSVLNTAIDAQTAAIEKTRENSVKKSGDTMTGDLVFDAVSNADIIFQDSYKNVNTDDTDSVRKFISAPHQIQGFIFSEIKNGVNEMQFSMVADGLVMPFGNRLLGSTDYPWEKIYAKKLNNGADIAIPTLGGTLARIEDLQNATTALNAGIAGKQDKLTAGENITIEDGVISATGGGGGISKVLHDDTLVGDGVKTKLGVNTDVIATKSELESKQDKLTAGENITIEDGVISSTAQESFYRGKFISWNQVPTDYTQYLPKPATTDDTTPTTNDFIVVSDASDYAGIEIDVFTKDGAIIENEYWALTDYLPVMPGSYVRVEYTRKFGQGAASSIQLYDKDKKILTSYQFPITTAVGDYVEEFTLPVNCSYVKVTYMYNFDTMKVFTLGGSGAFAGTWRFYYNGAWDTDGKSAWKPQYQIENTLPIADDSTLGIAKLYASAGLNTDGAMTQKSVSELFNGVYTKAEIDSMLGEISTVLDTINGEEI